MTAIVPERVRLLTPREARLARLAEEIRGHELAFAVAMRGALDHHLASGRKFIEAKTIAGHGGWLPWLFEHFRDMFKDPADMAGRRMKFARYYDANSALARNLPVEIDLEGAIGWFKRQLALAEAEADADDDAPRARDEAEAETDRYRLLEGDSFAYDAEFTADPVDFLITDAPYKGDADAVGLCERLAQHAPRWLKPDGSMLLMIGQMFLPEIMRLMAPHIHYRWTLAYLTPGGQAVQIWPHGVNTFWKPVIWFTNGGGQYHDGWRGDASDGEAEWVDDTARSATNDNDKRHHEWGQSESGMHDLMRRFVSPGATVLDPFMGAGTTGVIALRLGCRFVGVDMQAENVRIAAGRLAQEQAGVRAEGAGGADGVAGSGAE